MGQCHCKPPKDEHDNLDVKPRPKHRAGDVIPPPDPQPPRSGFYQLKDTEAEYAALVAMTNFRLEDIAILREKFETVTKTNFKEGNIKRDQFLHVLGQDAATAPLIYNRVFDTFDYKKNSTIDFQEFVCGLSHFAESAPQEEKINFAFKLFDLGGDDYIHKREVKQILEPSLRNAGVTLEDAQIDRLVDQTFKTIFGDDDGDSLNYAQFFRMCKEHPEVLGMFTIPFITERAQAKSHQNNDSARLAQPGTT